MFKAQDGLRPRNWSGTITAACAHIRPLHTKIPAMSDRPREFNVNLWDRSNLKPTIYRSKAVGEPPFMLGISAWLAISDAISNCGPAYPNLDAPATPERVLKAVERVQHGL